MRAKAATIEQDTFAANRAIGRIGLAVAAHGSVTRRARVREDGSLRVRFPNGSGKPLEAVIVNTAGGMAGGDRFSIALGIGAGANFLAGTAAAEKVYRSTGADTSLDVSFEIGARAQLAWLPQETILFDGARLARRVDIELAEDASLVMAEAVVFGRTAMGEVMQEGYWSERWRLRRGGRLRFAENVRLGGAIAGKLKQAAVTGGSVALATVLIAPGNDATAAAVRAIEFSGEAGVSAWNGIAVARLLARDGAVLRRDLVALLRALGTAVPRLWLQ